MAQDSAASGSQQQAPGEQIDQETEPCRYALSLTSKHVPFRAKKQMPQVARRAQPPTHQQASDVNRRAPMPSMVFPTLKLPSQQPKLFQFSSQSEESKGVGESARSCNCLQESMERPQSGLNRSGAFRRTAMSVQRSRSALRDKEDFSESSEAAPPQSPGRSQGVPPPPPLLGVPQQIPQPPSLPQQMLQPPKSPQTRSPDSPPAVTSGFLQQLQAGRGGLKSRTAPAPQQLPKSAGSPKPQSPGRSDRTLSPHSIQDIPQSPISSQHQSPSQSCESPPAATSGFLQQLQAGRGGLKGRPPPAPQRIPSPPNVPQPQSPRSPPAATSGFLQQLQAGRGGLKGRPPPVPQQIPSPPNVPQPQSPSKPCESPPVACTSFMQQLQAGRGGLKRKPPIYPRDNE